MDFDWLSLGEKKMERDEVVEKLLREEDELKAVINNYKAGLIGLKDLDSAVSRCHMEMRDVIDEAALGS